MSRLKIEDDLKTHPSLSHETMILAMEAEKDRRAAKGYSFHGFVVDNKMIDLQPPPYNKSTQLDFALGALLQAFKQDKIKDHTRVSLMVKSGVHWTTVDLEFSKKDGVSVFVLDAAKDPRYWDCVSHINKVFRKIKHEIYVCAGGLQYDHINCAVFTLHHTFKASKIGDLHTDLKAKTSSFTQELDGTGTVYKVNYQQIPHSLLSTIQRPQSIDEYLRLNPHIADQPITKKGLTLHEILMNNIKEIDGRFTNTYISKVQKKTTVNVEKYLQTIDDKVLVDSLTFWRRLNKEMLKILDPDAKPAYHVRSASILLPKRDKLTIPASIDKIPIEPATHLDLPEIDNAINDESPFIANKFKSTQEQNMNPKPDQKTIKEELQLIKKMSNPTKNSEDPLEPPENNQIDPN